MTGAPREVLTRIPLLAGLEPSAEELVRKSVAYESLPSEMEVIRAGGEGSRLIFLLSGELAVLRDGRVVTLLDAPRSVGLVSLVDRGRRSASVKTLTPVEIASIDRDCFDKLLETSPTFARHVLRELAHETRGLYDAQFDMLESFDDFFESPNARLIPGPYEFPPFPMSLFIMEDDPRRLEALLPPGLRPIPGLGGRYLLSFSFISGGRSAHPQAAGRVFAYQEATPFIPCVDSLFRPGVYTPEVYPDAYLAIALGREIYGFPKRFGRVTLGDRHVELFVGNRLLLQARWDAERSVEAAPYAEALLGSVSPLGALPQPLGGLAGHLFALANREVVLAHGPQVRVFVRKQIPAANSIGERTLQVDQLVEVPFRLHPMSEFTLLENPALRFFDPTFFVGGECVAAFRCRLGFTLGAGQVRRDYLPEDLGASAGLLGRVRSQLRRFL